MIEVSPTYEDLVIMASRLTEAGCTLTSAVDPAHGRVGYKVVHPGGETAELWYEPLGPQTSVTTLTVTTREEFTSAMASIPAGSLLYRCDNPHRREQGIVALNCPTPGKARVVLFPMLAWKSDMADLRELMAIVPVLEIAVCVHETVRSRVSV